ncbi:TlpA disulfide reductase family protein [Sulfurimonas sp. HSL3-2]|uniref:TlpA family protein disulfide reductase n=1 Tax=Hydrocurvibacter mobilis TaxID=3131936 RepID=UPI0031F9147E
MFKIIVACIFFINIYANDILQEQIDTENKTITILCFYTTWCPACKKSIELLNEIDKNLHTKVKVIGIDLDDGIKRKNYIESLDIRFKVINQNLLQARRYGVKDSVPVILIVGEHRTIVKRFYELPNRKYFFALIQRLSSGYLENGTLPVQERIDLWKKSRD